MATYPTNPASTFVEATDLAIFSANQLYDFVNGDITKELETEEGGLIPSVAKALNEAAAYKTPTAWVVGETQTDLMLLREYNSILYAPRMVPVVLGSSPTAGVSGEWRVFPTVENGKGIYDITNPDVNIPFADGISITTGFGTFDQIDVSAAQDGSIMVDLPSKSVTFSRSSTSTNISKGGQVESLALEQPAVGKDGLAIFNTLTNEILYSEDFTQWTAETSASVTPDTTTAPDGLTTADTIEDNSATVLQYRSQGFTTVDDVYTYSVHLKPNTAAKSSLSYKVPNTSDVFVTIDWATYKLVSGDLSNSKLTILADGWVRIDITTPMTGAGTAFFQVIPAGFDSPVSTTGSVYAWGAQLAKLNGPYIKTDASVGVRQRDVVSIDMVNNLPAAGEPFTIVVDTAIPLPDLSGGGFDSPEPVVFGVGASKNIYLRRKTDTEVWFNLSDSGGESVAKITADNKLHRFVCRYDGTIRDIFVDGVRGVSSSSVGGKAVYSDTTLRLGREIVLTNFLNSYIKNFRIYHSALTDEQISLLGAPNK